MNFIAKNTYAYLAGPYTNPSPEISSLHFEMHKLACAALMASGLSVISPIVQGHSLLQLLPEPLGQSHDFWMAKCKPVVNSAETLILLLLPGWEDSKGVKEELVWALERGLGVTLLPFGSRLRLKDLDLFLARLEELGGIGEYEPLITTSEGLQDLCLSHSIPYPETNPYA